MTESAKLSPAEEASERALAAVRAAIVTRNNFKLEAGAGAGKTYSLVAALRFLLAQESTRFRRLNQRIACITFTNVAKEEIEARTDRSPAIHCDTIHAFCWSAISGFQSYLRTHLLELPAWSGEPWAERLRTAGGTGTRRVEYTLGYRAITDEVISIHHNDVLPLMIRLLEYEKFRNLLSYRYPIILIDEYQDTDADWIAAIRKHFLGKDDPPLFGFFGDHWQKIYGNGCGKLVVDGIAEIGKEANFRSVAAIVECLNRMRSELKQFVVDPKVPGEVRIYHTNGWKGSRQKGAHYGEDLPDSEANSTLAEVRRDLEAAGWDFSPKQTKILMLTHRALGKQQGYSSLATVFRDNSAFAKKEHVHIAFFADHLEPACRAFAEKHYGEMFDALGTNKKYLLLVGDKKQWAERMTRLIELRQTGTVADVINHLREGNIPQIVEAVDKLERKLATFDSSAGQEMPRTLRELQTLHGVPYREIISLTDYLDGHSPFETKHGVKGAQFENVLVVVGRGWSRYNFGKMLENIPNQDRLSEKDRAAFEDNRNLFYVACSRPQKRLALLFTQLLSPGAIATLGSWFGMENITDFYK